MTGRRIDVEITFSGIGILWIREALESNLPGARGPGKARNLALYFPDTAQHPDHPHQPAVTYFADDAAELLVQTELGTSPEGREVVTKPLAGKRLFIETHHPYSQRNPHSTLAWCPPGGGGQPPEVPAGRDQDHCLDWLLNAKEIGLGEIVEAQADTIVHLPEGRLSARGVFRNRQSPNLPPVRWRLGSGGRVQAIARELVLRLEDLWQAPMLHVVPKTGDEAADRQAPGERIRLLPGADNLVRIAITNQPVRYYGEDSHLPMLASLTTSDPGAVVVPERADDVQTIGSACEIPYRIG